MTTQTHTPGLMERWRDVNRKHQQRRIIMATQTHTHTPGPWRIGDTSTRTVVIEADRRDICWTRGNDDAAHANARLIASAPDLLAALKDARAIIEDASMERSNDDGTPQADINGIELSEWHLTAERIRNALAKAEGR